MNAKELNTMKSWIFFNNSNRNFGFILTYGSVYLGARALYKHYGLIRIDYTQELRFTGR